MYFNSIYFGACRMQLHTHTRLRSLALLSVVPILYGLTQDAVADTDGYRLPPQKILDVISAPPLPEVSTTRDGRWVLLQHRASLVGLDELATPVVTLAGHQVDPKTNGSYGTFRPNGTGFTLIRVSDQQRWPLTTPGKRLSRPLWAPDGRNFVFLHTAESGIELWVANVDTRETRALIGPEINAAGHAYDFPCTWMPDNRRILCLLVPKGRGSPPSGTVVPGPAVQESDLEAAPISVRPGMLRDAQDEALFDYYMTAQPTLVDIATGAREPVGEPGIYDTLEPSPNDELLLSIRVVRPYSYLLMSGRFPKVVEILNLPRRTVHSIASLPLDESGSPLAGYAFKGPRRFSWVPGMPATLAWIEPLDGGDPRTRTDYRDRLVVLDAPFTSQPVELIRTKGRMALSGTRWASGPYGNIAWGDRALAWVEELDFATRRKRIWLIDAKRRKRSPSLLFDFSADDASSDPGSPFLHSSVKAIANFKQDGDWLYLTGRTAGPEGDTSFLVRLNLENHRREPMFRSDGNAYEEIVSVLGPGQLVTRHETLSTPPVYYLTDLNGQQREALTSTALPSEDLRGIRAKRIHYHRADGLALSGDLYLPAGYVSGTPVPTVIWAYPRGLCE